MKTAKAKVYKITQTITKYVVDLSVDNPGNAREDIVDAIHDDEWLEAMECMVIHEQDPMTTVNVRETEVEEHEDGYLDFDEHPLNYGEKVEAELTKLFGESI